MTSKKFDVVIIGAGHNGLTCAGYLARAGLSVKVLERRHIVGGAAVTEEIHPGFRCTILSFLTGMLEPKIVEDLELKKYGFELISRPAGPFIPELDGPGFLMPSSPAEAVEAIRQWSPADAKQYLAFDAELQEVAQLIKSTILQAPPNAGGGIGEIVKAVKLANRGRKLSPNALQALVDLFTTSIGQYLDSWFNWDRLKGMQTFGAMTGVLQSPYAPNTAYGLLHHAWGTTGGKAGKFDYSRGGMGGITQAMLKSAEAKGVEVSVNAGVREVIVENGRANGVVLEDGTSIRARAVISNLNPNLLFTQLVDNSILPERFGRRMKNWRSVGGCFRISVALSELPDFTSMPGTNQQIHHTSSAFICPSLQYFEDAYLSAAQKGWSDRPIIDMTIPSTLDDTLAPPGQHVATLFCQHVMPKLPSGQSWDEVKGVFADLVIDTVTEYAPNFKRSIIARQALSPLDLEREWGLVGGCIFHGCQNLDQIFSLRPAAGYADYRTPVPKLYMCGSGTHPGGGVTGAPGHNAAQSVIRDFRSRKVT